MRTPYSSVYANVARAGSVMKLQFAVRSQFTTTIPWSEKEFMLEQVKRSNKCFTPIITDNHIHIKNMHLTTEEVQPIH